MNIFFLHKQNKNKEKISKNRIESIIQSPSSHIESDRDTEKSLEPILFVVVVVLIQIDICCFFFFSDFDY